MTPALVAGASLESPNVDVAAQPDQPVSLRYRRPEPVGSRYSIPMFGRRLSVVVRPGDSGWIARAAELDALGYGSSYINAIDHLADVVEEYLKFLRDDRPRLAEEIAHHAEYVELLGSQRELWFASVEINATPVE
jgi:hypothetical protein